MEDKLCRKRLPSCKRCRRARAMELWQMDVVEGVLCEYSAEAKILTGTDDHSRSRPSAHPLPPGTRLRVGTLTIAATAGIGRVSRICRSSPCTQHLDRLDEANPARESQLHIGGS